MTIKSIATPIVATMVAAIVGVVGLYLPWVRQLPAGHSEGEPIYNAEYAVGADAGFHGNDSLAILLLVAVVAVVLLARQRNWRPEMALFGVGGLMLWMYGRTFHDYWNRELYVVEPGLYLMLASGVLLVLGGIGAVLDRQAPTSSDDSRGP